MFLNDLSNLPKNRNPDLIKCKHCSNTWFEEVKVNQYEDNFQVVIEQSPPPRFNGIRPVVLRCLKCQTLNEPSIMLNNVDKASKIYNEFRDQVLVNSEKKDDIVTKV